MHTAIDDLESFFWVLIWALSNIFEHDRDKANSADLRVIDQTMKAFRFRQCPSALVKRDIVSDLWPSAGVFGSLIQEWLAMLTDARKGVDPYALPVANTEAGSQDREVACDQLQKFCEGIYQNVLDTGYKHLQIIGRYSKWDPAMFANMPSPSSESTMSTTK
jgi:hypothetical protein